jgi:hypothetical protein
VTEEAASRNAERDISVDSTEVLTSDDDVAEVRIELTVSDPDGGQSESYALVYELRTDGGDWRVWAERSADGQ